MIFLFLDEISAVFVQKQLLALIQNSKVNGKAPIKTRN
jgi:hypothetical protein